MSDKQLIERVWNAPLTLVWELWTTPEGLASWWGPPGFIVAVQALELRVGGAFSYTMTASSDEMAAMMEAKGRPRSWGVDAVYAVVEPPHKLAYDSPFGGETMTTSVTFTETDDGVQMVLTLDATKPGMTGGAAMGWKVSLDKFAKRLESA
jgi:uncharacterized protein YndB with AHSA1/START domain